MVLLPEASARLCRFHRNLIALGTVSQTVRHGAKHSDVTSLGDSTLTVGSGLPTRRTVHLLNSQHAATFGSQASASAHDNSEADVMVVPGSDRTTATWQFSEQPARSNVASPLHHWLP